MDTFIQAVERMKAPVFQMLAREIYERLALTDRISFEEILENDVYLQVGDKESFTFSVEVRGDDAEFFLYKFNFLVSNENDFETYKENILRVVEAAVQGDYHIELLQVGARVVKSEIVFKNSLRIGLYDSVFFQVFRWFIPKRSITLVVQQGKKI